MTGENHLSEVANLCGHVVIKIQFGVRVVTHRTQTFNVMVVIVARILGGGRANPSIKEVGEVGEFRFQSAWLSFHEGLKSEKHTVFKWNARDGCRSIKTRIRRIRVANRRTAADFEFLVSANIWQLSQVAVERSVLLQHENNVIDGLE